MIILDHSHNECNKIMRGTGGDTEPSPVSHPVSAEPSPTARPLNFFYCSTTFFGPQIPPRMPITVSLARRPWPGGRVFLALRSSM